MSSPLDQPRGRRGLKRGVALMLTALLVAAGTVAAGQLTSPLAAKQPRQEQVQAGTSGTAYCPVLGSQGDAVQLEIASASATEESQIVITRFVDGATVSDDPRLLEGGQSAVLDIPEDQLTNPIAIEWRGAPVVAQYRKVVDGQEGVANCQTQPSDRWYLTGLDTNRGNTSTVYLFNPFGQDAVVQVRFGTPEGPVDLLIADEITVPAGRVVTRDLAEFLPETSDLAISVIAQAGRVIAQGEMVRGPAGEGVEAITGRALVPAESRPSEEVYISAARSDSDVQSWVTVYNPSQRSAAVQIQVTTPLGTAALLTTELNVPAGGTARVDLDDLSALPLLGVRLTSVNSIGLVATRTSATRDGSNEGLAVQESVPTTDRVWTVPGGRAPDATLTLFNPGAEVATAEVSLAGQVPSSWDAVTVPPNGLAMLSFDGIDGDGAALVRSDVPLVAGVHSLDPGGDTTLWSSSGIAEGLLAGGRDAIAAQRDPSLASRPAVSATATPTPLPEVDGSGEEGQLDPMETPSIIELPDATPTPSPGVPLPDRSPAAEPQPTRPTPTVSDAEPSASPSTSPGPRPGATSSTEEGSLFGTLAGA